MQKNEAWMGLASEAFDVRTLNVPRAVAAGVELLCVTFDFHVTLDAPVFAVLSDDERVAVARFLRQEDAIRYAATRVALRHALGARVGLAAFELQFERDPAGRPRLAPTKGTDAATPDFNVSHSGRHALIALAARRRVGVDIEARCADLDWQTLATAVLTLHEEAHVATLPADLRADAFYDAWTAKEALLKAIGVGIGGGMTWFSVLGDETSKPLVRVIDKGARYRNAVKAFDVAWCTAPHGYAACVAWSREEMAEPHKGT